MNQDKLKKISVGDLVLFKEKYEGCQFNYCIGFVDNISSNKFGICFFSAKKYTWLATLFMSRLVHFKNIKDFIILKPNSYFK